MRSRIRTHIKNQSRKSLLGIILLLIILVLFGTQLLIGFAVVLDKIKGKDEITTDAPNVKYIAPPVINPISDATNSKSIAISGYAGSQAVSVNLYLNNELVDETKPKSDKSFTFNNITLTPGENELKAKAITKEQGESSFSQVVKIKYLNKEPILEVSYPLDGQTVKKEESPIKISGKTDPNVRVTVNDFQAIVTDYGDFSYLYSLKDGENNLKINATDSAGNKTEKEIKVTAE